MNKVSEENKFYSSDKKYESSSQIRYSEKNIKFSTYGFVNSFSKYSANCWTEK